MKYSLLLALLLVLSVISQSRAAATDLTYACSKPPLEATFKVAGDHYNGSVMCGNMFTQCDIPDAPVVRWEKSKAGKLYTLLAVDFDGDAHGAWPDPVKPGENSPIRHWVVGNIPGTMLKGEGYVDSDRPENKTVTVLQKWRSPHIPVVSDRYGLYLFEQSKRMNFAALPDPVTNFDCGAFLKKYDLAAPVASNWFVALYTSASPFSGTEFHGNPVSEIWHKDLGQGKLVEGPSLKARQ